LKGGCRWSSLATPSLNGTGHTDKRIKKGVILGVGSQIMLVAVIVGLTMVAHYGVLDQALAK
jgi:hypothetical protein